MKFFQDLSNPIKFGMLIIFIFFGCFGIWALLAPIDSAAISMGTVSLDSNRKIIQHLEGGIIEKIFIKEGDFVEFNQPLIQLKKSEAHANTELLYNQLRWAKANELRLLAEQNKKKISFDHDLLKNSDDPNIKTIIESQTKLFDIRKKSLFEKINILNSRVEQLNNEIQGLDAQKQAAHLELAVFQKEEQTTQELLKDGYETQSKLSSLQTQIFQLQGQIGQLTGSIAKAQQTIGETKIEIINLETEYQNEIAKQLFETRVNIRDLQEKILAAEDVMKRLVITAPQSGIVSGLKFHTIGGVIPPATEIMMIVPQNDKLIIESRLKPDDIDLVHPGLKAKIRLLAYRSRHTPLLIGTVVHVSPDKFVEQQTNTSYFLIRIEINDKELENFKNKNFILYPGMPAEVLIVTGSRSFVSYLLDPIKRTFRKSFRED